MLPRGTDPHQFMQPASFDRNSVKVPNIDRLGGLKGMEFRQDTKLFKRASFHIGIAYNIHIEIVKQRNPHFTQ